MTPTQAMQQVTLSYTEKGVTPYEINNGNCYEWAEKVLELLQDAPHQIGLWEVPFDFGDTEHAFLSIDGTFYDAECLEGVADHMGLPIFVKLGGPRQPVWLIDCTPGWTETNENKRDMTDAQVAEYNLRNGISAGV